MTANLPDVVRAFERSYSRLADRTADLLFSWATWFAQGSPLEVGLRVGIVVALLAVVHYALGGATAMGDKKPMGPMVMWLLVAVAAMIIGAAYWYKA
jgi:hypothetical protein